MGYGKKQMHDLEETINKADVDLVVSGTPIDLTRVIKPDKPIIRVKYDVGEETLKQLRELVDEFVDKHLKR